MVLYVFCERQVVSITEDNHCTKLLILNGVRLDFYISSTYPLHILTRSLHSFRYATKPPYTLVLKMS